MAVIIADASEAVNAQERKKLQLALGRLDFFLADARESVLVEPHDRALEKINGLLRLAALLVDKMPPAQTAKALAARDEAVMLLGQSHLQNGTLNEAIDAYGDAFSALLDRGASAEQLSGALVGLIRANLQKGDFLKARQALKQIQGLSEKDEAPILASLKKLWEGEILLKEGKAKEAHPCLEEALTHMQKVPLSLVSGLTQLGLFSALTRISRGLADPVRARRWLAHAFTWLEKISTSKQFVQPSNRLVLWHFAKELVELLEGKEKELRRREVALAMAEVLFLKGRWAASLEYVKTAEDGLAFDHAHARAMLTKARSLGALRKYGEAVKCVDEALDWGGKQRASSLCAKGWLEKGVLLLRQGSDNEGLKCLVQARSEAGQLDRFHSLTITARTRQQEAFLEIKRNSPKKALEVLDSCKEMLEGQPVSQAKGEMLRLIGQCHTELRDFAKAERFLLESLSVFQELEMVNEVAQAYRQLGLNATQKAALEEANFYLDEAIEILQRLDMVSEIPLLYTQKGKLAMLQEDYKEAERIFREEMAASRRAANPHMLAFAHYHLGQLFRMQKRVILAEKLLGDAANLFLGESNRRYQGLAHMELAMLFTDEKKPMRALEYLAKAEPLLKEQHNPFILAKFYMVKGHVLAEVKGKGAEARHWYKMALEIYEKQPQSSLELAEAYHEMADLMRQRNDMGQCITFYRKAIHTAELLGFSMKTTRWLEELEKISPEDARKIKMQSLAGEQVVERMEKAGSSGMMSVSRQELSIYFVDIRGFTSTTERLSLQEMTSFLNDFYLNMSAVVMRNRGMINKFIGDNIMALYNVSNELPDHPLWAVRTGMEMQAEINKINTRREKRGEVPINLGVGVNTGEVLLGSFGSVLRQDFTAIGDAVNTAARLQSQAKAGEVIISDATYQRIKDRFQCVSLGEVQVKGKAHAVRMWRVEKELD